MAATVDGHSMSSDTCITTKLLTEPALFTRPAVMTMAKSALLWRSAETAAQAMLALSHPNTESTKCTSTAESLENRTCCKRFTNVVQLLAVSLSLMH